MNKHPHPNDAPPVTFNAKDVGVSGRFPRVSTVTAEDVRTANRPSTKMLLAISATGKHLYQGTVSGVEKANRRRRNKAARSARRARR